MKCYCCKRNTHPCTKAGNHFQGLRSHPYSFTIQIPPKEFNAAHTLSKYITTRYRNGANKHLLTLITHHHHGNDDGCEGYRNLSAADKQAFLSAHNEARAKVGVDALVWDNKVEAYAISYAQKRQGDCELQHSPQGGGYGENLFWGGGKDWKAADAVKAWVDEEKDFDSSSRTCPESRFSHCGHYSQVVWRKTLRVGCAKVICASGDTFINCNYDPPGNYIGEPAY